ncbi:hypothetical protein [Guggenheimella bovis]
MIKRNKITDIVIQALLWALVYALCFFLKDLHYVLDYIAFHYKFYLVLAAVSILLTLGNPRTGFSMTLGHGFGLFLGVFLGDFLRAQNMLKIKPGMDAGEVYILSTHKGVFIWLGTIIVTVFMVGIISFLRRKRNEKVE